MSLIALSSVSRILLFCSKCFQSSLSLLLSVVTCCSYSPKFVHCATFPLPHMHVNWKKQQQHCTEVLIDKLPSCLWWCHWFIFVTTYRSGDIPLQHTILFHLLNVHHASEDALIPIAWEERETTANPQELRLLSLYRQGSEWACNAAVDIILCHGKTTDSRTGLWEIIAV
jgi:hypothetical protein